MTIFNVGQALVKNSGLPGQYTLSEADLCKFVDGLTTTSGVVVSGTIGLDVALERRFKLSEFRYYYSGTSDIHIYFSQMGDLWEEIGYSSYSGYVAVSGTLSSFVNWPSYIRLTHQAVSGVVRGFEVEVKSSFSEASYNDSFPGPVAVDSCVGAEIIEVPIRNTSNKTKDFHFLVGGDATNSGVLLLSTNGADFYSKHQRGIQIPGDYSWSSGQLSGVSISGQNLVLNPASGTGYYYSPIFDISLLNPMRVYFAAQKTSSQSVDWEAFTDGSDTIGIRRSDTQPEVPWISGQMAQVSDPCWSIGGSLQFHPVVSDCIIADNLGTGKYVQLAARLNGAPSSSPTLNFLGVEESITISGIEVGSSEILYVSSDAKEYVRNQNADILIFSLEND